MPVPKACEISPSQRIRIGATYSEVSTIRRVIGVALIYLPIMLFPFIALIMFMTIASLKFLGANNLKSYRDFVPDWRSHRYNYKDQIVQSPNGPLRHLSWRSFWIFNCSIYCPLSVALFEYMAYLVKAVENWWCPFYHSCKSTYACSAIDQSYWHAKECETFKLHPDDRENPIWNEKAEADQVASDAWSKTLDSDE